MTYAEILMRKGKRGAAAYVQVRLHRDCDTVFKTPTFDKLGETWINWLFHFAPEKLGRFEKLSEIAEIFELFKMGYFSQIAPAAKLVLSIISVVYGLAYVIGLGDI